MFVTQKMVLVDLLVLEENVEDVSKLIINAGYFEPSTYSSVSDDDAWHTESTTDKKRILSAFQKDAQTIKMYFDPHNKFKNTKESTQKEVMPIPAISDMIRQYVQKKRQLEERATVIRRQKEDYAVKIAGLRMHNKTASKSKIEDPYSVLGLLTVSNLNILKNEFARFGGEIFTEAHVNNFEIVYIRVPSDQKKALLTQLEHLYFVNYGTPEEFSGGMSMMHLGLEYTLACDQEDMLEDEIKKIKPAIMSNLSVIMSSLELYNKISEIRQNSRQVGHFVLISGWITAKSFRQFKKDIENVCGSNNDITVSATDTFKVQAPTKLSNPKIFKPFQQLVTTFGIPGYTEIDPTIIFGVLYVLMYGAMFGDVGQGALMCILGIIGTLVKRIKSFKLIFNLMIWVGAAATVFGFLYGSYFGYEREAGYGWVPNPAIYSPIHAIDSILMHSIIFGMGVICFSFILGIINAIRSKDYHALVFSHHGVVAFAVYGIVLAIVYLLIYSHPVPIELYVILGVFSLFLGLERVWDAVFFGHGSVKDSWMGFFDMFEFFLSMLTNTLSFVRIGAFALTHAALMMAIFTLQEMAGGDSVGGWVVIILGNLFVIGVEGFIVVIQTLRLEYYEFFLRFFKGSGRMFKPISYN